MVKLRSLAIGLLLLGIDIFILKMLWNLISLSVRHKHLIALLASAMVLYFGGAVVIFAIGLSGIALIITAFEEK